MSSPVHHAKDLDAALMYAPPWARDATRLVSLVPDATPDEALANRRHLGDQGHPFSGDLAVLALQRRFALDPESVPEPAALRRERSGIMIALRMCAVTGIAALVAWVVVSLPPVPLSRHETAAADSPVPAISVDSGKHDQMATAAAPATATVLTPPEASAQVNDGRPGAEVAASRADAEAPAAVPPPAPAQPPQPDSVALRLDDAEIVTLLKRGEDFLKNGDLVSARLLLKRAAEAGSASAALSLGDTFDPLILQRLGAIGVQPDAVKAREWYQRATELGSDIAAQKLAKLAQARQ